MAFRGKKKLNPSFSACMTPINPTSTKINFSKHCPRDDISRCTITRRTPRTETYCCRSMFRRRSRPADRRPRYPRSVLQTRCCDALRSDPWCQPSTRRDTATDRASPVRARCVDRLPILRRTCYLQCVMWQYIVNSSYTMSRHLICAQKLTS